MLFFQIQKEMELKKKNQCTLTKLSSSFSIHGLKNITFFFFEYFLQISFSGFFYGIEASIVDKIFDLTKKVKQNRRKTEKFDIFFYVNFGIFEQSFFLWKGCWAQCSISTQF